MQAKTFSKMSGIELADIQIPGLFLLAFLLWESLIERTDRELYSRHDGMDGVEESRPTQTIYHQRYADVVAMQSSDVYRLQTVLPTLRTRLAQRPKYNGAPTLLFLAGAALRVADATRVLKDKDMRGEKGGDVAKLFAKHIKLEEHIAFLRRTKLSAAVGTPGRIGKLLERGTHRGSQSHSRGC